MKRLFTFVAIAAAVAIVAWALHRGFTQLPAAKAETPKGEPTVAGGAKGEDKPAEFVVKLDKTEWQALGVEKDQLTPAELKPQRVAFGRVLDPAPLVTLDDELAASDAATAASRAERDRTQKLLAAGESASRKSTEAAELQFQADQIKAAGLRRQAALQWGEAFPLTPAAERAQRIDRLVRGDSAIARVDLLPGDALLEAPQGARLLVLGREQTPFSAANITVATDIDPKTQAQGYLLRVDDPPFPLRPGMALTAWLELPAAAHEGFAIPRSAILRHDGRAWVYVQAEEEKFVRKSVRLESPLDGDAGWFIPAKGGGLQADDLLVVTGAQSLLSEELKAQGGDSD